MTCLNRFMEIIKQLYPFSQPKITLKKWSLCHCTAINNTNNIIIIKINY